MSEEKKTWYKQAVGFISAAWKYLDGKKNKIANTALTLSSIATVAFPESPDVIKYTAIISLSCKLLGIGHKYMKDEIKVPLAGLRK